MTPFEEALTDAGVRFHSGSGHQHSREGWVQFDCPFCGKGSGKYHMGYRISGGYVNCWRCGRQDLLKVLEELRVPRPWEILATIRQTSLRTRPERRKGRPSLLAIPRFVGDLGKPHRDYLRKRGFKPREIARLWGIRGIGIAPAPYSWRIWIPIAHEGQNVSWTARSIGQGNPRYLTCPASDEVVEHSEILFGEDFCRQAIIVVEGPLDAIKIGPGAAATLGLNFSAEQIRRIAEFPVRVICLDSQPQAQRRARQLANSLAPFPGETHVVELDAKDPGEASDKEIKRLRRLFL